ncbi:MAG: hypothetical protein A2Z72_06075 [Omnitrophica bacterium RBG_13_46_9]|nr:MAG: hypothetical protein A2Z72_06075 [Omnitrophica bacterium RBG_13_46_9]
MEKRLGKGLNALIPENITTSESMERINKLKINSIKPSQMQPRKKFDDEKLRELKDSIMGKGIIQPIVVRPVDGGYELIAGERRFRAAKELGFDEIPAIVKDVSDADSLELSLIENIQREELNPVEEAHAYMELIDRFNFSQDDISKAIGKDKSTVSNAIRILALPKLIQDYISENLVSMGHAKAILSLPLDRARIKLAKKIIRKNLSVRQTEEVVRLRLQRPLRKMSEKDGHLISIEEELQHFLGTRVKITHGKKRGRIEISYYSNEDLERILRLIKKDM